MMGISLLYQPAYSKYGFHLWHEHAHAVFTTINIVLLFVFAFTTNTEQPSCFPSSGANTMELTGQEKTFVDSYCAFQAPLDPKRNMSVIIFLLLLLETISYVLIPDIPLSLFAKAVNSFESLKLPLDDIKRIAVEPHIMDAIDHKSVKNDIRNVMKFLNSCNGHVTRDYVLLREWYMTLNVTLAIISVFVVQPEVWIGESSYFYCYQSNLHTKWSTNGVSEFFCISPCHSSDWLVVILFFIILVLHYLSRIYGLMFMLKISKGDYQGKDVLFLKHIWTAFCTEDEKFGEFVEFYLSDEFSDKLKENLSLVGSDADPKLAKLAINHVALSRLHVTSDPNLRDLIEGKHWKWIVALLNKFPQRFQDDSYLINGIKLSELDCNGRSILYYALNREPGSVTFYTDAAKLIMRAMKPEERIVYHDGVQVPAKKFLSKQFVSDRTYPERLRNKLLKHISMNRNGQAQCETSK